MAEFTYTTAGLVGLFIGWGLLSDKWLAFLPISFMAWRDSVAGLAMSTFWRGNRASIWPSMAMLGV